MARDEFFWLGEINKATAVINTGQGLLDPKLAPRIAAGLAKVLADAEAPGAPRPNRVIAFEPLLIAAAGPEVTLLHAGRSSQDMHATFNAAILREWILDIARNLATAQTSLRARAAEHVATIVPNYTNGVAAQPNSLAHQFLGHFAALQRDADRLREAYARVDRCPMGTTVLNGTGWPLDRDRMAAALGFAAPIDNAYDAAQLSPKDALVELGQIVTSIALHVGGFIEDLMPQYSQAEPWILLKPGKDTTYASSAMPQKRNPGLLNDTRRDASTAIGLAVAATLRLHNLPTGMPDAKDLQSSAPMHETIRNVLKSFDTILNALVIDPDRALAELNADWTASQELADVLMRKYQLPFRIGHHFASEIVDHAKAHALTPLTFPYAEAQRIYAQVAGTALPLTQAEFHATLDPVAIVNARATKGGPQPAELARMLADAERALAAQTAWIAEHQAAIDTALAKLDAEFEKLLK